MEVVSILHHTGILPEDLPDVMTEPLFNHSMLVELIMFCLVIRKSGEIEGAGRGGGRVQ